MGYNKPMNEITKEDMIREFDFEYKREQSYFEYMYRSVQFSFVAIVAVFITASELYTPYSNNKCKCQRKSEPGAHEKVSHKRPRKSEPERSRIVEPVC